MELGETRLGPADQKTFLFDRQEAESKDEVDFVRDNWVLALHVFPQPARLPAWQLAQFAFQIRHLHAASVVDLLTCISIPGKVPAFKKGKVKITIIATTTGYQWAYDDDDKDIFTLWVLTMDSFDYDILTLWVSAIHSLWYHFMGKSQLLRKGKLKRQWPLQS